MIKSRCNWHARVHRGELQCIRGLSVRTCCQSLWGASCIEDETIYLCDNDRSGFMTHCMCHIVRHASVYSISFN